MPEIDTPPVLILCGGRGTRLQAGDASLPKPLVEVGGMPIVWHVVRIYAAAGFERFELLTGHRGDEVERFAATARWPEGIEVACRDTGMDTPTGGRVRIALEEQPEGPVCVTYADGVADIDLPALLSFHRSGRFDATITVVRPELPFGVARLDGDLVTGFTEKPQSDEWVNGGFMVVERSIRSLIGEAEALEREPLERLANSGRLGGYRHEGFWHCMDTYKDQIALNDLWEDGGPPWRTWN